MLPSKWRPPKGLDIDLAAIAWPLDAPRYLLVLPPDRLRLTIQKLGENPLQDEDQAALERVAGSNSVQLELDKIGRFRLPEHLAQAVGITDEAEFVGRLDKFEIWDPNRYEAESVKNKQIVAATLKRVAL